MKKLKLFLENFIIYGFGGIISKVIPLIMLPIITRVMPGTEYYGVSDMANTVVQFGIAVAILGMYDALYRLFFDKDSDEYKKNVCSSALFTVIPSAFIMGILLILFKGTISRYFFGSNKYEYVVYIAAFTTMIDTTNTILATPTRVQNLRKIYMIGNTIGPLLSYGFAMLLIYKGYYVIALPLGLLLSTISMSVYYIAFNYKWFSLKRFDKKLIKPLMAIGIPLMPNTITYWIFNSCDRIMITNLLSVGQSGIYSIGSKLGHVSQLIYTAFAGGWQYFAFSTMKEKNQVESNSMVFEYLGVISYSATMFVCALSFPLFKILFAREYVDGYIIAPYLFLAPLLLMLYQVATSQFIVIKKTWPNMFILLCGAILNLALNAVLIPKIGIEGAAIATLAGYVAALITAVLVLLKMKLMVINRRFVVASVIMGLYIVIWRLNYADKVVVPLIMALLGSCLSVLMYRNELISVANAVKGKLRKNEE